MEQNTFYNHVSSWIKSYRNPEALAFLTKFITGSQQPDEVKAKLLEEVEHRIASLTGTPGFTEKNGVSYLVDGNGHPKLFTTRFGAITEIATLKMKGYDVELVTGTSFYRIKLNAPLPVQDIIYGN